MFSSYMTFSSQAVLEILICLKEQYFWVDVLSTLLTAWTEYLKMLIWAPSFNVQTSMAEV